MIKRIIFSLICLLNFTWVFSQVENDSLNKPYLEDQLYLNFTYNSLFNKPSGLSQNGFSGGISSGFIKDIPFNKRRSLGIALGVGYSYDVYIQNLKIFNEDLETKYNFASDYKSNSMRIHTIDVPFEFRIRNSSIDRYKFFRVYFGLRTSFVFASKAVYEDSIENIKVKNIDAIGRLKYGLTLSAGYSTWNLFIYYGLDPILNDVNVLGENLDFKDLKVGLIFYIM